MRRLRSGLRGSVLVAALVVGPLAGAAAAAPRPEIESVVPTTDGIDVTVRGIDLPAGAALEPHEVAVTLDGQAVPSEVAWQSDPSQPGTRRSMLIVDTSGSTAGPRIEAARSAATAYLDLVPADVEVGLLAFSETPRLLVAPTRDRAALHAAVGQLQSGGGTSLYDAVLAGRDAVGQGGERRLVLLTDTADDDNRSLASLDAVVAELEASGVQLDVVLAESAGTVPTLERLAAAGHGGVLHAADAASVTAAFQSAARAFDADLRVRVAVPDELSGRDSTLRVTVGTSAGPLHVEHSVALPGVPTPPPSTAAGAGRDDLWASSTGFLLGLAGIFVGLFALLAAVVVKGDSRAADRSRTHELLGTYTLNRPEAVASTAATSALGSSAVARTAVELAGRVVQDRGFGERLALRLDRAQVSFTAAEWLVLQAVVVVLAGALTVFATGSLLVAMAAAPLAGLLMHAWLSFKAQRRCAAFVAGVPDALQLAASGLTSGYSLPQAFDAIVREGQEPVAGEIGRALAEARLGVPLESALDTVADRMDSTDFRWVVMAIRVQREVGGNLAEVLTTVCQTIRDRASLRRQVKALSAEGRISAIVLIGLPISALLFLSTFRWAYVAPLFTEPIGVGMLVGSAVALLLGALWMNKLVKVEM